MANWQLRGVDGLLALAGAVAGFIIGYDLKSSQFFNENKWWLLAVLGGIIGLLCGPLYRRLVSSGWRLNPDSIDVDIPGLKLNIKLDNVSRAVAWRLFVETSTRIATQPLGQKDGVIREALASLYKLFEIVRTELKSMSPSPAPSHPNEYTIETYAVEMLNDAIRPCLARWHPKLLKWEKIGLPETEWPLGDLCRTDLEATRVKVITYAKGLSSMLKVSYLQQLLPTPQPPIPILATEAQLLQAEEGIYSILTDTQKSVGWNIFIELISRVATQPLDKESGRLREALSSLYKLYDIIRKELTRLSPAPRTNSQIGETVESIALHILNGPLRTFLSEWHPKLLKWESQQPDGTKLPDESKWELEGKCRQALDETRKKLLKDTKKLGELIEVQMLDHLLSSPTDSVSPTQSP